MGMCYGHWAALETGGAGSKPIESHIGFYLQCTVAAIFLTRPQLQQRLRQFFAELGIEAFALLNCLPDQTLRKH